MRLPALVVIATVGLGAGQVPVIQTRPANQPPRDVVSARGAYRNGAH